jgi:hypothetical protein
LVIVFHHIPRTGGTTIAHLLSACLGDDAVHQWRYGASFDAPEGTRAMVGHFPFGAQKPRAKYAVSVLRDPATRLKSQWQSIRHDPRHFLYARVHGMAFVDYVRSGLIADLDNGMTRLLSGRSIYGTNDVAVTMADLRAARRNVQRLALVGITPRLDIFCADLGAMLGCDWVPGKRHNATGPTVCTGLDRALVERRNPYDVELYEYVRGRV